MFDTSSSRSNDVSNMITREENLWVVPDVGKFDNMASYVFTGYQLPTGLSASDYDQMRGDAPYQFLFDQRNVTLIDGEGARRSKAESWANLLC